ncbi:MAG: hypothetical protein ACTHJ8_19635, partial [Mucilaginibacter sp.]
MRKIALILFPLFIYSNISSAQNTVVDTHPSSQIYAIDYQSGQETLVDYDQAILFKDAFIDLVNHTTEGRAILQMARGRKTATIKQIDPRKLNGYQLTWQTTAYGQSTIIGTFYYNIDQNALYFYDKESRDWVNIPVIGQNQVNLDNCQTYSRFNSEQGSVPDLSLNNSSQSDLSVDQATADMQAGLDTLTDEEISTDVEPPALPDYDQPPCPADGYLWQPGYWAYSVSANDYYWVPGVWVAPPRPDLYWTPGYWAFVGGVYRFHRGYWGPSVGFYGGIHYGFGYFGVGFVGGEWRGNAFRYNTAVVHVNTTIVHNTYVNNTVVRNTTFVGHRASFNGQGGIVAKPTAQERVAMSQPHLNPTNAQIAHQRAAVYNKSQFSSVNRGRPAVVTMTKVNAAPANYKTNIPAANNGNRFGNPRNNGNPTPGNPRDNNFRNNGNHAPGNPRVNGIPGNNAKPTPELETPKGTNPANNENHMPANPRVNSMQGNVNPTPTPENPRGTNPANNENHMPANPRVNGTPGNNATPTPENPRGTN